MKLVLSHETALDLLRAYRCGAPFELMRSRSTSLSDSAHTRSAIAQFEIPSFERSDGRLHVLVPDTSWLCDSKMHVSHLATYQLPVGSLMQVSKNVFTASPALVFLQYAPRLDWLNLALLGAELCGKYSLLPAAMQGMSPSVPVAEAAALAAFVEKLPHARGARTARLSLNWIPDWSASPLETRLYLLLTLPVRRGGYGLPKPEMNPPTHLRSSNARMLDVDELHCDLHWLNAHVALEYNSKDSHIGQLTRDARRANVLISEGESVFTMTPAILADPAECDALVKQMARVLGVRLQGNALGLSPKRAALRGELFPWI